MTYRFHPEALSEFESAAVYYAEQQHGLGFVLRSQCKAQFNILSNLPSHGASLKRMCAAI